MYKILLLSFLTNSIIYAADQHNNALRIPIYFAHANGDHYLVGEHTVTLRENLYFKDLACDIREQYSIDGNLMLVPQGARTPLIVTHHSGFPLSLIPNTYSLSFFTENIYDHDQPRTR